MTRTMTFMTALVAIGLSASCKEARTNRPVATNAGGDTTLSPSGDSAAGQGRSMVRLVNALPAQMLGYHAALLRGNDPDKPRNLAKSVTVK